MRASEEDLRKAWVKLILRAGGGARSFYYYNQVLIVSEEPFNKRPEPKSHKITCNAIPDRVSYLSHHCKQISLQSTQHKPEGFNDKAKPALGEDLAAVIRVQAAWKGFISRKKRKGLIVEVSEIDEIV